MRVACPARGTLLASKRLDAYLSVFKWTLELAGIPVAPALLEFLAEVAQRRADVETDSRPRGADSRQPAHAVAARSRRSDSRRACAWSPATSRATRSRRG